MARPTLSRGAVLDVELTATGALGDFDEHGLPPLVYSSLLNVPVRIDLCLLPLSLCIIDYMSRGGLRGCSTAQRPLR